MTIVKSKAIDERRTTSTVLHSRKFWALVVAIVATASALATGDIAELEALRLAVQALMVYIGAVAIEDGLSRHAPAPSAPPTTRK